MIDARVRFRGLAAGCLMLLVFTAGCQPQDTAGVTPDGASDSTAGTKSLPALHVVLAWESQVGGENWERKNYRARLEACRGSGMPMHELSAEEEAKLGTGEVEIMIDARRQFARQVSWTLGADGEGDGGQGACLSRLEEHRDQDTIDDASGMYEPISGDTKDQHRQDVQATGWKLLGDQVVQDQRCSRWRNEQQEVCMWAGGMQWGFDEAPADAAGCTLDTAGAYLTSIPLESKPLQGGNGCILRVKSFSLGKGLIPANVPGKN